MSGNEPQIEKNGQGIIAGTLPDSELAHQIRAFKEFHKDKITVMISEPSIGMVDYRAHESCVDLICSLKDYEKNSNYKFFKTCIGRLMVSYAREKFCEIALEYGFDYIFFIDDDHIWDPDMFQKLEKHLKEYDIVAPLCLQRAHPYNPVMYRGMIVPPASPELPYSIENAYITDFKKGDLVECDAIGFGAAIVKVSLLSKIEKPWFFSMSPVGEDILFCMKAKQVGARIAVDTSVDSGHLIEKEPIIWRDYVKATSANNAELREQQNEGGGIKVITKQHEPKP